MFASRTGGLRCPSSFQKPWLACLRAAGIEGRFTVHGLRRTFVDLARRARVDAVVTRSLILRWHVDRLKGKAQASELLFPSRRGRFRTSSSLDKPFDDVATKIGLGKRLTPRGMRRTFQDLARAAEVKDIVTRSISGHATEEMQHLYSTVAQTEIQAALGKVISLARYRELLTDGARWCESGGKGGDSRAAG